MDKLPADSIGPVGPDWPKPFSLVLLDTLPWALLRRPVLLVATAHPLSEDTVVALNEAELSLDDQQRLLYCGRRPHLVYFHDPVGQLWALSQP